MVKLFSILTSLSMEGVWSLFKRSKVGNFHKMNVMHINRYLEELEWKFNGQKKPHIFLDALQRIVKTYRMTYKKLVA